MLLPWLGPWVAAQPLAVRTFCYATAGVVAEFLLQTVIWAALLAYERAGLVKKNTRDPRLARWWMLLAEVFGYYSWQIGAAFVVALYNPTFDSWSYDFNFWKVLWWQFPLLVVFDAWFFWVHRLCHVNKWLFNHVHAMHHSNDAYLSVFSNSYETMADGFLVIGLPCGCIAWAAVALNNYWLMSVPLYTVACFSVFGHSGYQLTLDTVHEAALLGINPFLVVLMFSANHACPMDHEEHHTNPRTNYSHYFTYWDEMYGCAYPKLPHHPLRLWALGLLFYFPAVVAAQWALWDAPATFALLLALQLLTPLPRLSYAVLGGAPSRLVTRLPAWDAIRRDYLVTYARRGEPGALVADPSKRYMFCYQPMGVQARGAWYTFAGKGRESPVAPLADVKLAVGRVWWGIPGLQLIVALFGCCDSSYRALKALLTERTPKSVCLTIGGYREAKYLGSYSVATKCRRGFARLAMETGASIVPVIGIGEPFVCGEPALLARVLKSLVPYRPVPLKVVFGEPIEPRAGEDLESVHGRYCLALTRLAKQHDVPLRIVE